MGNSEGKEDASTSKADDGDARKWLQDVGLHRMAGNVQPEKVRLALVGPQQSGKSSVASRFLRNSFAVEHRLDKVVRHGVRSVALGEDGEKWVEVVDVPGNKTSYTGEATAAGALRAELDADMSYGFQGVLGDLHKAVIAECDILCLVLRADGDVGSDVAAAPEAMARAVVHRADSLYGAIDGALEFGDDGEGGGEADGEGSGEGGREREREGDGDGNGRGEALDDDNKEVRPRFAVVNRCDVLYDRGILTNVADTRRYLEIVAEWARKRRCETFFVSAASDSRHCVSRSFKEMLRPITVRRGEEQKRRGAEKEKEKEQRRHFVSVSSRHSASRREMQRRAELFRDLFGN